MRNNNDNAGSHSSIHVHLYPDTYRLKRKMVAEQRHFHRESVEARDRLKDLGDRQVELSTQNEFLREAIVEGQMGSAIDIERFETLYAEFVRPEVEAEEEEEEEFSDVEGGDHPQEALSALAKFQR
jgi:hypothetical protein